MQPCLVRDAQHAARAGGRIIDRAHHTGLTQHVIVLDEQQVHHEPDDLARREVLASRFVRKLSEAPNQLLEHGTHLGVADDLGVQIDVRELLSNEVQEARFLESIDRRTHFAMAQQDVRYYLNGMLLEVEGGLFRAVATDGHLGVKLEALENVTNGASKTSLSICSRYSADCAATGTIPMTRNRASIRILISSHPKIQLNCITLGAGRLRDSSRKESIIFPTPAAPPRTLAVTPHLRSFSPLRAARLRRVAPSQVRS
jgi:hypothetical protein